MVEGRAWLRWILKQRFEESFEKFLVSDFKVFVFKGMELDNEKILKRFLESFEWKF